MSADNGGSAFPVAWPDAAPDIGMSLRDYFAASVDVLAYKPIEALQVRLDRHPTIGELAKYIAEIRHIEADAMIAERSKP
jgi:hypothetical protein